MIKLLILALRVAMWVFNWLEARNRAAEAREKIRRELGEAVDDMVAEAARARAEPVTAERVRDDDQNRLARERDAEKRDRQGGV